MRERFSPQAKRKMAEMQAEITSTKAAVVATIGGTVEGLPTSAVNYLQRLRQLVAAEREGADAMRQNAVFYASLDGSEKENARLRRCLEQAGLQAFMRDKQPEEVGEHLHSVALSWDNHAKQLEAELEKVKAERDALVTQLRGWLQENGPGGWIDELRKERDYLKESVTLYRSMLSAKWQEEP